MLTLKQNATRFNYFSDFALYCFSQSIKGGFKKMCQAEILSNFLNCTTNWKNFVSVLPEKKHTISIAFMGANYRAVSLAQLSLHHTYFTVACLTTSDKPIGLVFLMFSCFDSHRVMSSITDKSTSFVLTISNSSYLMIEAHTMI